jgi:hypothetical protein
MNPFLLRVLEYVPLLLMLILGAGLMIFWQWTDLQRRRMAHTERLAALEKGAPIPPESETNGPSHRQPLTRDAYMLRGLLWSAIGLGILATGAGVARFTSSEGLLTLACLGFIPFALGLAYLLYARLIRRD